MKSEKFCYACFKENSSDMAFILNTTTGALPNKEHQDSQVQSLILGKCKKIYFYSSQSTFLNLLGCTICFFFVLFPP